MVVGCVCFTSSLLQKFRDVTNAQIAPNVSTAPPPSMARATCMKSGTYAPYSILQSDGRPPQRPQNLKLPCKAFLALLCGPMKIDPLSVLASGPYIVLVYPNSHSRWPRIMKILNVLSLSLCIHPPPFHFSSMILLRACLL